MGFASRWSVTTFAPPSLMLPFVLLAVFSKNKRSQALATIALIGTTTYVPVVGSAISVWRCEETDYGEPVLAAAPSISCDGSGYYYNILVASIIIAAVYLCGIHGAAPRLSKKIGYQKVKCIFTQDFREGKEWWFHVAVGYKLATLFVAAIVTDALAQLILMLFFSSSMTLLCFTVRPHSFSNEDQETRKYWNKKCSGGCCSCWSIWCKWTLIDKSKWACIQCGFCCIFPIVLVMLRSHFLALFRQIPVMLTLALLAFLPVIGPLCCGIKCYYTHVFKDGFSSNSVETLLHAIETVLVFFSFLYQAASKKLEHPNQLKSDDGDEFNDDAVDDLSFDENGDYISDDQRYLNLGLTFVYVFGLALSTFEMARMFKPQEMARMFKPREYIKKLISGEASNPVTDLAKSIAEIFCKKNEANSEENEMKGGAMQAEMVGRGQERA